MRPIDADFLISLGAMCIARRDDDGVLRAISSLESIPTLDLPEKLVPIATVEFDNDRLKEIVDEVVKKNEQTGVWLDHYYPHFEVPGIECSECHKDVPYWTREYEKPGFCPSCGSRMKAGDP